jgi:hypothetical protein
MSTRGFIGVVIDGTEKLAYNHSDSYPSWLGVHFLGAVADLMDRGLEEFKTKARNLRLVDEDEKPTDAEMVALARHANLGVSTGDPAEWYVLLRNLQGELAETLDVGYMIDYATFALHSLHCEWGYLVDLDREVLQAYKGFQTEPPKKGRWAGLPKEEDIDSQFRYFAVELVGEWPLSNLPDDDAILALEGGDDE